MTRSVFLPFISFFLLLTLGASTTLAKPRYNRTVEEYKIPDITLINQDGEKVRLVEYLDTGKPVILEFIFATCTTICPILSIGFTNLQEKLGPEAANLRLVSISIDPEHDTPEVMKSYLQRYEAQPGWDFLTGSISDINQTMRAFDAYVSDKMGHRPLIFLHSPKENTWVRIDGLMSGKELKDEYLRLKK
ncbi:MAG: SCO family protein [Proteobacteria bacterium]|nr:SCO family protein [Pseudomonadota bacterium]MBU1137846.1 SCO family protein [Pseudomonadota bacterium]MBU1418530.1 SCO family protein [Pseudomonadota bacterium]MBU1453192.1 SCO family protein [Pseudomonadota bacterium]